MEVANGASSRLSALQVLQVVGEAGTKGEWAMKVLTPIDRVADHKQMPQRYKAIYEAMEQLRENQSLPVEIDYRELAATRSAVLDHFKRKGKPVTSRYDRDGSILYFQFVKNATENGSHG